MGHRAWGGGQRGVGSYMQQPLFQLLLPIATY